MADNLYLTANSSRTRFEDQRIKRYLKIPASLDRLWFKDLFPSGAINEDFWELAVGLGVRGGYKDRDRTCQLSNCHDFTWKGLHSFHWSCEGISLSNSKSTMSSDTRQSHLSALWPGPWSMWDYLERKTKMRTLNWNKPKPMLLYRHLTRCWNDKKLKISRLFYPQGDIP